MKQESREPMFVHCGKCSHEWAIGFAPMDLNTLAKVGSSPCPKCKSRKVFFGIKPRQVEQGQAFAWLTSGDTGISSKTIWSVLMPHKINEWYWHPDVPQDPSDFGRCYRLLKVMPAWRERLPEVAAVYPEWKPFVDAWDELTELYEKEFPTGVAGKLYERMQKLRNK